MPKHYTRRELKPFWLRNMIDQIRQGQYAPTQHSSSTTVPTAAITNTTTAVSQDAASSSAAQASETSGDTMATTEQSCDSTIQTHTISETRTTPSINNNPLFGTIETNVSQPSSQQASFAKTSNQPSKDGDSISVLPTKNPPTATTSESCHTPSPLKRSKSNTLLSECPKSPNTVRNEKELSKLQSPLSNASSGKQ